MSSKASRRKCRCCNEFFLPDYRNGHHQIYCSKPPCRLASRRASQRRWLSQPSNRDYFRGGENVQRVHQWRKAHPGYWKKRSAPPDMAQEPAPQPFEKSSPLVTQCQNSGTLQDVCFTVHPVFIGLISMITGITLQEDIVCTTHNLEARGRDILGLVPPGQSRNSYDYQTPDST